MLSLNAATGHDQNPVGRLLLRQAPMAGRIRPNASAVLGALRNAPLLQLLGYNCRDRLKNPLASEF